MLQGTIDEFPLIDVLGILQARNKTGRLEIERQAGRGLIYVRLGEPYYAESSLTRSLIGQKLVDIGAITDMQLRKALDRQAESGERLGQILLTHGVISADHVAQAVISQIKDALADLLAWEAGEFKWETGAEVEVEVPLFGAAPSFLSDGANPLAPHVIPITGKEPDTGSDSAESEAVVEETDFPQGGTTMTTNEVTALPNESIPDAEQDVEPEVTADDAEDESDRFRDSESDDETEQVAEDESDDDESESDESTTKTKTRPSRLPRTSPTMTSPTTSTRPSRLPRQSTSPSTMTRTKTRPSRLPRTSPRESESDDDEDEDETEQVAEDESTIPSPTTTKTKTRPSRLPRTSPTMTTSPTIPRRVDDEDERDRAGCRGRVRR